MSSTYFMSNLVAKLPIKGPFSLDTFNLFNDLIKNNKYAKMEGGSDYFKVYLDHHTTVELTTDNHFVVRRLLVKEDDEGFSKISLRYILKFQEEISNWFPDYIIGTDDISVQAYTWYNCSEEPLE